MAEEAPMRIILTTALTATVACGQTDACRLYVDCQKVVDGTVSVAAYEPNGECWSQPAIARTCDDQCSEALSALRKTPGAPQVCTAEDAE
jgi:hypothetical protein